MSSINRLTARIAPELPAPAAEPTPQGLYDSHFSFVWRNLRRLGIPEPLLEDAAQDVFLIVHRRWNSFDARTASVQTWLFGILMRVARNHRRSLRRRAWLVPSSDAVAATTRLVAANQDSPAETVERREAAALLDRLLDVLDDDKRAVLVLVDLEQLPVPEAADMLGLNINTAYWRLRAARKQLEKAFRRLSAAGARASGGKR